MQTDPTALRREGWSCRIVICMKSVVDLRHQRMVAILIKNGEVLEQEFSRGGPWPSGRP